MPTENRSSNTEQMAVPFRREDRYIVIKRSDLKKVPVNYRSHLVGPMFSLLAHLPDRECLVIESGWPEFEPTWAAIEARVTGRPAAQHQGEPVKWSSDKPTEPGAYWVSGNGLGRVALVEVAEEEGELRCNLHDRTTSDDFGCGYSIAQLSEEFEWSGPLYLHPPTSDGFSAGDMADQGAKAFAARDPEVEQLQAQLTERDALLRESDEFMYIMTGHDSHARLAHRYGEKWWDAIEKLRGKVCTALSVSAAPEAKS